jgi:hypothetical protein
MALPVGVNAVRQPMQVGLRVEERRMSAGGPGDRAPNGVVAVGVVREEVQNVDERGGERLPDLGQDVLQEPLERRLLRPVSFAPVLMKK